MLPIYDDNNDVVCVACDLYCLTVCLSVYQAGESAGDAQKRALEEELSALNRQVTHPFFNSQSR